MEAAPETAGGLEFTARFCVTFSRPPKRELNITGIIAVGRNSRSGQQPRNPRNTFLLRQVAAHSTLPLVSGTASLQFLYLRCHFLPSSSSSVGFWFFMHVLRISRFGSSFLASSPTTRPRLIPTTIAKRSLSQTAPRGSSNRAVLPRISRLSMSKMATLGANYDRRHKVTVVGSGNWGSTIAKIVAENTKEHPDVFEPEVQMWVFEEQVAIPESSPHYDPSVGDAKQKLTGIINKHHENVKYLPGIRLPENVIANPDLIDAAKDSTILVFNLPHQFIAGVCKQLRGHIVPYARAISCIKGVHVSDDDVSLFSEWIGDGLGIYCGALSGANIASEIAAEKWCATTVAYDPPPMDASRNPTPRTQSPAANQTMFDLSITPVNALEHRDARGRKSKVKLTPVPTEFPPLDHKTFKALFRRPYFHVRMVSDVAGTSLGGALKNVVALAAGFVVGKGWGDNAKSEICRLGIVEMIKFGKEFFPQTVNEATFTVESAGMADLVTSCSSGRNFRCAKMAVERGVSVEDIERTELNGQMLQGTSTAKEVNSFLKARGLEHEYPLFTAVIGILEGKHQVDDIPDLVAESEDWDVNGELVRD